jgi:hypothetical protein
MPLMSAFLLGASAMGSLAAALFFLRFWRRSGDSFFLVFSAAFAIEGLSRLPLALEQPSSEAEPFYYLPRLVAFSLIVLAVILKNRPDKG